LFIKYGGIVKNIFYALIFENYDYIFKDYVNFFTELRKESNELNLFGKLMINSMYGRLGMKNKETETLVLNLKKYLEVEKKINIISKKELNEIVMVEAELNANLLKITKKQENSKIKNNVVLAGAITSKARIKLYNAQQAVITNKGQLLYSDTDSIFASYRNDVINEIHGEIY
jgi:hypothetical protein